MLKKDLILQIINYNNHYLKGEKAIGLMKGELVGKITEFPALRPKKYSYLADEKNENKNVKGTKSVS